MKESVFVISFLFTFYAFAGVKSPFDLRSGAFENILTFSEESLKAYMRPDSATVIDSYNHAPQVGRLVAPKGLNGVTPHGSGFFVEQEDGSRNKIVTSAHNFFDDNGDLRFPIETYKFEVGSNTKSPETEVFRIKKIECATSDPEHNDDIYDQCLVTLDKDIADKNIPLVKVWDGDYNKLEGDIKSYFIGYHGYREDLKYKRTLNECTKIRVNADNTVVTNCNSSTGMSGGLHAFNINGQLYAVGIIKGTLYNKKTGQIGGNYSVPIINNFNKEMKVTLKAGDS